MIRASFFRVLGKLVGVSLGVFFLSHGIQTANASSPLCGEEMLVHVFDNENLLVKYQGKDLAPECLGVFFLKEGAASDTRVRVASGGATKVLKANSGKYAVIYNETDLIFVDGLGKYHSIIDPSDLKAPVGLINPAQFISHIENFGDDPASPLEIEFTVFGVSPAYEAPYSILLRQDGKWLKLDRPIHALMGKAGAEDEYYFFKGETLSLQGYYDEADKIGWDAREIDLIGLKWKDIQDDVKGKVGKPTGKPGAKRNAKTQLVDEEGKPITDLPGYIEKKFKFMDAGKPVSKEEAAAMLADPELRKVRLGLANKSSVILGESGAGKTYLAEKYLRGLLNGVFPEGGEAPKVIVVDAASLSAGTKYVGTGDAKIAALLEYARIYNCIVFIDELHTLLGSGTHSGKSIDVFENLKTAMAKKELKLIATDTSSDFYAAFGGNAPLLRRIKIVPKEEPKTEEEIVTILKVVALTQPDTWVSPSDEVLFKIVNYSNELNALGAQPSRAVDLLEALFAYMKIEGKLAQAATLADLDAATKEHYNLDASFLDPELRKARVLGLEEKMSADLIGMQALKDTLVDLTAQVVGGVGDKGKPAIRIGVFGPRGTGKTEGAKVYAKAMGTSVKRIEMNQFAYTDSSMFLAQLKEAIRENPHRVIILDEFEKASVQVQNALLAVMDSGFFEASEQGAVGRNLTTSRVDARKISFVLTSNAAGDFILGHFKRISKQVAAMKLAEEEESKKIHELLSTAFTEKQLEDELVKAGISAPFLDRLQSVMPAFPATRFEFRKIVVLHFNEMLKQIRKDQKREFSITNTETFIDELVAKVYYPGVTNRVVLKALEKKVRSEIGMTFIKTPADQAVQVTLSSKGLETLGAACDENLIKGDGPRSAADEPMRRIGFRRADEKE
jgi:SpoVK/Ycf46/Vps4 family AAA+-type ATPase